MKSRIDGDKIYLRKLVESDAESIAENLANKHYSMCIPTIPHPYTLANAKSFIKGSNEQWESSKKFQYAVVLRQTGELIGCCAFTDINYEHKRSELGYWISKKYWRQGYGTEMLNLMIGFAFNELKLHRIAAGALAHNTASQNLLQKCGFKKEGIQKERELLFGKYHDRILFGILAPK